eukprot:5709152-Alexandrium_andersonii.AAC.1
MELMRGAGHGAHDGPEGTGLVPELRAQRPAMPRQASCLAAGPSVRGQNCATPGGGSTPLCAPSQTARQAPPCRSHGWRAAGPGSA